MTAVLTLVALVVAIPVVAMLRTAGWGDVEDPGPRRTTWDPPGGPDA